MNVATILAGAPVLLVADVIASANYYRDKLGFTYLQVLGEPPNFCMIHRDGQTVMLSQVSNPSQIVPHYKIVDKMWNAYFWVDDVDTLYEEFEKKGATIDYGLGVKDYGVKEFGIQDLDGYDIGFGQIVE